MLETGKLFLEICRNLVYTLGLGLFGLSFVSMVQSQSHPFGASRDFQKHFFANLGVFRPDLLEERKEMPGTKVAEDFPTKRHEVDLEAQHVVAELTAKSREVQVEAQKDQQEVLDIKKDLKAIEALPYELRLSSLLRFRDEVVDHYRQSEISEHSYEYFMRQIQKRIYWEQKFQSVQQFAFEESLTEVSEKAEDVVVKQPMRRRGRPSRKVM